MNLRPVKLRPVKLRRGLLVGLLALIGCGGGGGFPTAPVHGTVKFDGAPVKGGSLTFLPMGDGKGEVGRPASGSVNEDGTYSLTGGGAVIGKNRIAYTAPAVEPSAPAKEGAHVQAPPPSPYAGLSPAKEDVEVKSGDNVIDIELKK